MAIDTYEQALNFIHGRTQFKKIPTLKRMRKLMEMLGNPQNKLTMIHVTGTNGKGSTVAFLRSILMAHGYSVGTFTSPFITRFNERISLDNQPIDDDDLVNYTNRVKEIVDQLDETLPEGGPTEFEIVTAIMFMYFADVKPDVVVVEVGIGGLYDSTNIIQPVISVITTVGYDHMNILGDTLSKIAFQKAGIIKSGAPIIIGNLPDEALTVIRHTASKQKVPLIEPKNGYKITRAPSKEMSMKIRYSDDQIHQQIFSINLFGEFQVNNAGVAIAAFVQFMDQMGWKLSVKSINEGLKQTTWPGRMELINDEPTIILDGAHNLPAMQSMKTTIVRDFGDRDVYLLVAILADKQTHAMIAELAGISNVHLVVTSFAGPKAKRPSANIEELIAKQHPKNPIQTASSWQEGLVKLTNNLSADDILIITGSLYFISDVRHFFKD